MPRGSTDAALSLPGLARGTAVFSSCGRYRYSLTREFGAGVGRVAWLLLNCSTATAEADDATIRRCINFSRAWGYGTMEIVNLFAFRATDPRVMKAQKDPIGPENDRYILAAARSARTLVCGWGTHGSFRGRDEEVMWMLRRVPVQPYCLEVTSDSFPRHPLYIASKATPIPYGGRQ
jgi:hypothetical protein